MKFSIGIRGMEFLGKFILQTTTTSQKTVANGEFNRMLEERIAYGSRLIK